MKTYSRDPYWTTARFDGPSNNRNGEAIKRGDRIFYYPNDLAAIREAIAKATGERKEVGADA